jgi:predicted MPP superfamily phosphohydrolase
MKRGGRVDPPLGGAADECQGLFHVSVVVTLVVAWRGLRPGAGLGAASVAARGALSGVAVFAAAVVFSAPLPDGPFALVRFLSQALFAEGPAWGLWLALRHGRGAHRWPRWVGLGSVALLLPVYWMAYHHGPGDLRISRYTLQLPGPRLGHAVRLVHVSDIQAWKVGRHEVNALRRAMGLRPDLIAFTGDYVQDRHRRDRPAIARDLRHELRRQGVAAPRGAFAVWGNTDRLSPRVFDGLPIQVLDNAAAVVDLPGGRTLGIVGLGWRESLERGADAARAVLARMPPTDFCMVLGHAPDFALPTSEELAVNLILAGHTHGGQVVVPGLGPLLTLSDAPRSLAAGGWHVSHDTAIHVSRGVGMERGSAPQIRFLCPPEITVIELRY